MSTIAAISTPNAVGGLAVIRISGDNALVVADKIFHPYSKKSVVQMDGYSCAYGFVHDCGERIDDCILTVFRAPHSYTGEDTCEISCHGGLFVSKKVLRVALKNGAENAQPGEFTKRAFLNGKIDLTQAEAVMNIISARSDLDLRMAEQLREGSTFKKVRRCSDRMLKILSAIAAWTDYPDEDIPEIDPHFIALELSSIKDELSLMLKNYDSGRIIREGVLTAIIGRPNVGKSTLFNCLSGCERSIVTDIAGTTRDVVEETVRLGDIILRLSDTAGIHDTNDIIEEIGINIAEKTALNAELVIVVFDGNCPLTADDLYLINKINNKKCIAVINKSDQEQLIDISFLKKYFLHIVYISAKNNEGIENLENAVKDIFEINNESFSVVSAANERQKQCIEKAIYSIDDGINIITNSEMYDALNVVLDDAEQSLLELTGERITEAVVDEVFSHFCVGK